MPRTLRLLTIIPVTIHDEALTDDQVVDRFANWLSETIAAQERLEAEHTPTQQRAFEVVSVDAVISGSEVT